MVFEGNYGSIYMNVFVNSIPNEKERKIREFKMDLLDFRIYFK